MYSKAVKLALLASTALGFVIAARPANAQLLDQYQIPPSQLPLQQQGITSNDIATALGNTVLTRKHPEIDPPNIRLGSFVFNATGAETLGFDSNPLALSHAKGSPVNITSGNFGVDSDWGRNGISARFNVQDYRYWDLPQENHTDYTAYLGGFLDIGRDKLAGSYQHVSANILPTGTDGVGFTQRVPFTDDEFRINYLANFGRLSIQPEAVYSMFRFDQNSNDIISNGLNGLESPTIGLNNLEDQRINNRNVVGGGVTAKYELSPGRNLIAVVHNDNAHYTYNGSGLGNRDYNDIQVLAGLDFQLRGPIRFRVLGGAEHRSYNNRNYKASTIPTFEAQIIWTPTQLTTITGTASRQIQNSVDGLSQDFTYTTGRLQIDHELRRNIILSGFVQVQRAEYTSSQHATVFDMGPSITYKLNRHVSLVGSYEYIHRSAVLNGNSYNESIGLIQLKFAL